MKLAEEGKSARGVHTRHCKDIAQEGCSVFQISQGHFWTDSHLNVIVRSSEDQIVPQACLAGNPLKAQDFNAGKELFLPIRKDAFGSVVRSRTSVHFSGSVACLASFGSSKHNFGHWFTDTLPKLFLLWDQWPRHAFDRYYFPSLQKPWQEQTAEMLGIKKEQIIDGTDIDSFSCDELFCTSFPRPKWNLPEWIPQAVRSLFKPFRDSSLFGDKIYVSRKDTTTRRPTNEKEVSDVLRKQGFRELVMSDLSLTNQIAAFFEAEKIVSLHSSSLALTMFSRPGCELVEIFGPGQISNLHYDIARANRLRYMFIKENGSSDVHDQQDEDPNLTYFPVDTGILVKRLSGSESPASNSSQSKANRLLCL